MVYKLLLLKLLIKFLFIKYFFDQNWILNLMLYNLLFFVKSRSRHPDSGQIQCIFVWKFFNLHLNRYKSLAQQFILIYNFNRPIWRNNICPVLFLSILSIVLHKFLLFFFIPLCIRLFINEHLRCPLIFYLNDLFSI